MFESPSGHQDITISDHRSLDALRKAIIDVIRGCRILLDFSYRQPIYVSDGCVQYGCMKIKHDDDVGKMFFIFSKFSSKGLIEYNANFG